MKLASPQFERQQDTVSSKARRSSSAPASALPAGQPLTLTVSGLPHHSALPRRSRCRSRALIVMRRACGRATRKGRPKRGDERKRLIARREKLFQDLVRLEHDHRRGRVDAGRGSRRAAKS